MSELTVASDGLMATVESHGAQLTSLSTRDGWRLLWPGNPATWPDHAPILFPVIGPLEGGLLRHKGQGYQMPPHGFARLTPFEVVEHTRELAVLELRDSEQTRLHYPFSFRLRVSFSLHGDSIALAQDLENDSDETLPADLGYHPGFRWPLSADATKERHVIVFEKPEPSGVRRGKGDPIALLPGNQPTPVRGNVLELRDELFQDGPIVFDQPRSRALTFGVPGRDGIRVDFPDSPYLALWMWPGEDFLAIEPWHGLPAPAGYTGPFAEKPGVALVPPGSSLQHRLTVSTTGVGV